MNEFFEGYTIGIEVLRHDEGSYESGGNGYTIFFKLLNQTKKKMEINVDEIYIINENKAQFEKNYWLTGFVVENTSVAPDAYKTAGAIFLESICGPINIKCKTGITVTDKTNGFVYEAIFVLTKQTKWELLSCEVENQGEIQSKRSVEKKLKKSLERLEIFEEKCGVRLDNISIKTKSDFHEILVFGDIFATNGESLNNDICINAIFYNDDNEIIGKDDCYFCQSDFMGYHSFEIKVYDDDYSDNDEKIAIQVSKIRLYVTKH